MQVTSREGQPNTVLGILFDQQSSPSREFRSPLPATLTQPNQPASRTLRFGLPLCKHRSIDRHLGSICTKTPETGLKYRRYSFVVVACAVVTPNPCAFISHHDIMRKDGPLISPSQWYADYSPLVVFGCAIAPSGLSRKN
jgi:hypothetical protein